MCVVLLDLLMKRHQWASSFVSFSFLMVSPEPSASGSVYCMESGTNFWRHCMLGIHMHGR